MMVFDAGGNIFPWHLTNNTFWAGCIEIGVTVCVRTAKLQAIWYIEIVNAWRKIVCVCAAMCENIYVVCGKLMTSSSERDVDLSFMFGKESEPVAQLMFRFIFRSNKLQNVNLFWRNRCTKHQTTCTAPSSTNSLPGSTYTPVVSSPPMHTKFW